MQNSALKSLEDKFYTYWFLTDDAWVFTKINKICPLCSIQNSAERWKIYNGGFRKTN